MRSIVLTLAAATAMLATPAMANEIRAEGRGGVVWDGNDAEAIGGVALGYDFDIAPRAFAGIEVSADKILRSNTRVAFGANLRAGIDLPAFGKLYATGGYASKFARGGEDSWNLGAGLQKSFLPKTYGKLEYRHYFIGNGFTDGDAVLAGVGFAF